MRKKSQKRERTERTTKKRTLHGETWVFRLIFSNAPAVGRCHDGGHRPAITTSRLVVDLGYTMTKSPPCPRVERRWQREGTVVAGSEGQLVSPLGERRDGQERPWCRGCRGDHHKCGGQQCEKEHIFEIMDKDD